MGLSKKKLSPLQIQTLGDAHFATPEEVAAAGLLGNKGIRLGYYKAPEDHGDGWGQIIRYSGDAHLITVAPTGSGKGRDVLVGALLEYEGSCIVIDPKGQLAAITGAQRARMGQKIIVLNPLPKELPMDLGPSAKYNPMAYLDPNSDAFGPSCEAIADSIVMMHEDDPNSHFTDSARQLIAGIIMHLAAHGRDGEKNLVMMQRIVSGPIKVLEAFVAEALSSDKDGFISGTLARFASVGGEDRELRSIISTATTQCGFINNKAIGASLSASDFSFRDLKREATTVYLVLPAKFIRTCGKWFRLVLASAIAELWRDEKGKYPILAIIDEFNQLGRLAVVADAMGMARGFGLQLWPILQDLPQLKGTYGDQWETFLGGAAVRQFFAPRETLTAEYVSKLCGVKTVVTQGQSVQHAEQVLQNDRTGVSWGQQSQPLLHPHNVSSLGPQECLILGLRNTVIDAFRKPYSNTPELEGLYSPDPYHKTDAVAQNAAAGSASFPPPTDSFAAREAAASHGMKKALAHKRALPLRLLTWGASTNPILNVLRKVEYLLTLPLRILLALVVAPFAIHNRPLQAAVGFLTLFGVWEAVGAGGGAWATLTNIYWVNQIRERTEESDENGYTVTPYESTFERGIPRTFDDFLYVVADQWYYWRTPQDKRDPKWVQEHGPSWLHRFANYRITLMGQDNHWHHINEKPDPRNLAPVPGRYQIDDSATGNRATVAASATTAADRATERQAAPQVDRQGMDYVHMAATTAGQDLRFVPLTEEQAAKVQKGESLDVSEEPGLLRENTEIIPILDRSHGQQILYHIGSDTYMLAELASQNGVKRSFALVFKDGTTLAAPLKPVTPSAPPRQVGPQIDEHVKDYRGVITANAAHDVKFVVLTAEQAAKLQRGESLDVSDEPVLLRENAQILPILKGVQGEQVLYRLGSETYMLAELIASDSHKLFYALVSKEAYDRVLKLRPRPTPR